ncbi:hypothetical protein KAW65_08315 [candidate division WOR-3 bacterium]|nr:hypothetical protein [candidate division WOR-3 bacterium]
MNKRNRLKTEDYRLQTTQSLVFGLRSNVWTCVCLGLLLTLSGCKQSPLLYRMAADYFPLEPDNEWIYLENKKDTLILKVIKNEVIGQRDSCWLLERNVVPEYWYKSDDRLDKFYSKTIVINGETEEIAAFWLPYLKLPLIIGNSWNQIFEKESYILGDTVKIEVQIEGEVVDLENENYKIRIKLIENLNCGNFGTASSDTTLYDQWYKPNVGMIKQILNKTIETTLLSYKLH